MIGLRSPEFGNSFSFTLNTRKHRTLQGNLRTFQGNISVWEAFKVRFTALSQTQIDAFIAYINGAIGTIVTLTDFEGRIWTGVITTETLEVNDLRSTVDQCKFETAFEFEGQVTGTLAGPIVPVVGGAGGGVGYPIPVPVGLPPGGIPTPGGGGSTGTMTYHDLIADTLAPLTASDLAVLPL